MVFSGLKLLIMFIYDVSVSLHYQFSCKRANHNELEVYLRTYKALN